MSAYVKQTDNGRITVRIDNDHVTIVDSNNSYQGGFKVKYINEYIERLENFELPRGYYSNEIHSTEVVRRDWYSGNYIVIPRMREIVETIKELIKTKPNHKVGNLKRMSLKTLLDVDSQASMIIELHKARKEGTR